MGSRKRPTSEHRTAAKLLHRRREGSYCRGQNSHVAVMRTTATRARASQRRGGAAKGTTTPKSAPRTRRCGAVRSRCVVGAEHQTRESCRTRLILMGAPFLSRHAEAAAPRQAPTPEKEGARRRQAGGNTSSPPETPSQSLRVVRHALPPPAPDAAAKDPRFRKRPQNKSPPQPFTPPRRLFASAHADLPPPEGDHAAASGSNQCGVFYAFTRCRFFAPLARAEGRGARRPRTCLSPGNTFNLMNSPVS